MTIKENQTEVAENEIIEGDEAAINQEGVPLDDVATDADTDNLSDNEAESCDTESQLTEELSSVKDKYIRLSAEFDNYRKRTLKEKMELIENGGSDIIKSILTVLDDFDRAEVAMDKSTDVEAIKEGVQLIYNKLFDTLKQKGLKEIVAAGEEFDTDFFEAVVKIPVEDKKQKGKVVDVLEKGYMLNDKVLRFAKVVVGE